MNLKPRMKDRYDYAIDRDFPNALSPYRDWMMAKSSVKTAAIGIAFVIGGSLITKKCLQEGQNDQPKTTPVETVSSETAYTGPTLGLF